MQHYGRSLVGGVLMLLLLGAFVVLRPNAAAPPTPVNVPVWDDAESLKADEALLCPNSSLDFHLARLHATPIPAVAP